MIEHWCWFETILVGLSLFTVGFLGHALYMLWKPLDYERGDY